MSPSEFDLRAALHDGEGDPVDAGRIVLAGRARAAQRRHRMRTGLAAAAVIAGLVGVGAVVFGGSDPAGVKTDSAGGAKMGSTAQPQDAPARAAAPSVSSSSAGLDKRASAADRRDTASSAPAAQKANPLSCPATAPATPGPAAGSTTAKMFAKPVAGLVVCSYAPGTSTVRSVTLNGTQARQFAASLENAPTSRASGLCPAYVRADQRTIRVLARSTDASALTPVVAVLNAPPCRVVATNGTAVRYGWTPPTALGPMLRQLVSPVGDRPKQGSPARS